MATYYHMPQTTYSNMVQFSQKWPINHSFIALLIAFTISTKTWMSLCPGYVLGTFVTWRLWLIKFMLTSLCWIKTKCKTYTAQLQGLPTTAFCQACHSIFKVCFSFVFDSSELNFPIKASFPFFSLKPRQVSPVLTRRVSAQVRKSLSCHIFLSFKLLREKMLVTL